MKAIRITFARKEVYTVDADKLPEGYDNDTLLEMMKDGRLGELAKDYEEFDYGVEEIEEVEK